MTATVLGPKKRGGNTFIKKRENSQSKNRKSFLLNKIMIHHIQNSRGRLVLKPTTEQPRQVCFKANYKKRKPMRMVNSQSCSSSNRARMLSTGDVEEEEAEAPELVPTC